MKKKNYFESYTYDDVLSKTVRSCRVSQTKMIRRAYPNYDEENDWVLWLVVDLFDKTAEDNLESIVNIKKVDGSEVVFTPILRKPYPNIHIHQVALYPSENNKRVYGIPLVFKTFEEIEDIKEISIKWIKTYIKNSLSNTDKSCVFAEVLNVLYHTAFEKDTKHPEHRMFTIYSYDRFYNGYYGNDNGESKEQEQEYYDQFADVRHLNVISSVKMDRVVNTFGYVIRNKNKQENDILLEDIKQQYANHFKETPEGLVVFDNVKTMLWKSDLKELFGYMVTHHETDETLTATYLAGVLPEPSFGF